MTSALQPEVATPRARDLAREDLGGSAFGLYYEGFDFYFKSDNAEVRADPSPFVLTNHIHFAELHAVAEPFR
jgi:hypothetical protein